MCLIRNLLLEETTMKRKHSDFKILNMGDYKNNKFFEGVEVGRQSQRKLLWAVTLIAFFVAFVGRKMGWF